MIKMSFWRGLSSKRISLYTSGDQYAAYTSIKNHALVLNEEDWRLLVKYEPTALLIKQNVSKNEKMQ